MIHPESKTPIIHRKILNSSKEENIQGLEWRRMWLQTLEELEGYRTQKQGYETEKNLT